MRTHLLKWGTLVMVLFGAALFAAGVSPNTAKAAALAEPAPPAGYCELTWIDGRGGKSGGGGNITLYANYVTDPVLKQTLQDYNLLCTNTKAKSLCILMPNSSESSVTPGSLTPLYLTNLITAPNDSHWIHDSLDGQYNSLLCDGSMTFAL